jgi:membrane protein DedA with SNARE-associated domain
VIEQILQPVAAFTEHLMVSLGYAGIVILMAIESACIPLPSEFIMPYSGYLVWKGHMGLVGAGVAGALGCVVGSLISYWVGLYGGRPLAERYGRWVFFSRRDLERADAWFARWGLWAAFVSRLMPIVRTFISFPAGIARVPIVPFAVLTFAGSFPWCLMLAWAGMKLADNWKDIKQYFHGADIVIGAIIVVGLVWWVWRGIRERRLDQAQDDQAPRAE